MEFKKDSLSTIYGVEYAKVKFKNDSTIKIIHYLTPTGFRKRRQIYLYKIIKLTESELQIIQISKKSNWLELPMNDVIRMKVKTT